MTYSPLFTCYASFQSAERVSLWSCVWTHSHVVSVISRGWVSGRQVMCVHSAVLLFPALLIFILGKRHSFLVFGSSGFHGHADSERSSGTPVLNTDCRRCSFSLSDWLLYQQRARARVSACVRVRLWVRWEEQNQPRPHYSISRGQRVIMALWAKSISLLCECLSSLFEWKKKNRGL